MFSNLTMPQQQWLAVSLLVIVVIVFSITIVMPLMNIFDENQSEIETLTTQIQRYNNKIASRGNVVEEAALMQEKIKNAAVFSSQHSVPLALADMQQKIKTTIAQAKGELISTQNLAQKPGKEEFIKIGINVRFSGRIETLKNVVYEFESARPVMMIENIKITGVRGLRNITTGKIDPLDKVDVFADIISFMPAATQGQ